MRKHVTIGAAGKSGTVLGPPFGAEHYKTYLPGSTVAHNSNVMAESPRGDNVDMTKKNPCDFLCGSGWFARIENRELGKNSLAAICTKFISTTASSPTITGGCSQAAMYI